MTTDFSRHFDPELLRGEDASAKALLCFTDAAKVVGRVALARAIRDADEGIARMLVQHALPVGEFFVVFAASGSFTLATMRFPDVGPSS